MHLDILPGSAVVSAQWSTIREGHTLIPMKDGKVLDWVPSNGSYRLWNYDPNNTQDILPGSPVASGQWASIREGHTLIPMKYGRVLDWVATDGSYRLWNYDPNNTQDILPGSALVSAQWSTIREGHTLILMEDGRVLDWVATDGSYRLWNYNPYNTKDIFPGSAVVSSQWASIREGHTLILMKDGKVLDWVAANGSYRLWNYNP